MGTADTDRRITCDGGWDWRCLHRSQIPGRRICVCTDAGYYRLSKKARGYDLGVLFTIIPEEFYHRLGWTSLPLHGFSVACGVETGTAIPSEWQVRNFNVETDLDAVASIHDIANAHQSGTVSQTRAYWDMKPSRIHGILPSVVAEKDGDIGGYLNFQIEDKCAEVLEVGYIPDTPDVLNAFVSYFMKTCAENKVEKITGMFSSEHPKENKQTSFSVS